MIINIIKSHRNVVAVCDKELLGKYFEEGNMQLDVKESFYSGEEVSQERAEEIMKEMSAEDATFNIVGKKSVETAIKLDIVNSDSVIKIQGVQFVLVLL